MYGAPSGVDAVYLKDFQTGDTIGAGATATAGYLFYLGEQFYPRGAGPDSAGPVPPDDASPI